MDRRGGGTNSGFGTLAPVLHTSNLKLPSHALGVGTAAAALAGGSSNQLLIPSSPAASAVGVSTLRPRSAAALATVANALQHSLHVNTSLRASPTGTAQRSPNSASASATFSNYSPLSGGPSPTVGPAFPAAAQIANLAPSNVTLAPIISSAVLVAPSASAAPSSAAPHPNEALISQIEEQWNEYARTVAHESTKSGAPGSGSASSLAVLLSRLQSNVLLNFFEFTSARQILTIYGPSFDCLYYSAPPSHLHFGHAPPPVSTIYRDRADYVHTLGNLTTLVFKFVDIQLVALQLPLIRQRMTKLKQLVLVSNNLHSLYQLDDLALLAPCPPPTSTVAGASSAPPSSLDSVTLLQNSVTSSQLYRRYLLSLLTMNLLPATTAAGGWTSPRSSRGGARSSAGLTSSNGVHALSLLDGQPISEEEVWASARAFGHLHRAKYVLNPSSSSAAASGNPPPIASRWLELLGEVSLHHHGGPAALGTAANPLSSPSGPSVLTAPSQLVLPLRPVAAPSHARKLAKKLVDDALNRAFADVSHARAFEHAWDKIVHANGGIVDTAVAHLQKNGTNAAQAPKPDAHLIAPSSAPTPSLSASNSTSALHRAAHDKTQLMRLFNTTANPAAAPPSIAPPRRKK